MAKIGICNMCGKGFDIWDTQEDFSIYRSLGYGTKYDGDELQLDLCCDCMEKIIDECKVHPVTKPGKLEDNIGNV